MKQKLNSIITRENGIMSIFNTYYPTQFAAIFENQTPLNLDMYIYDFYGERILRNIVTLSNFDGLIKCFVGINVERWQRYITIINKMYNTANYKEIRQKSGTLETENENTRLTAEKAFNDNEFINDNKDTDNGIKLDTYDLTETIEKTDNILQNSQNFLEFRKRNNIFAIIKEIVDYITLKIY